MDLRRRVTFRFTEKYQRIFREILRLFTAKLKDEGQSFGFVFFLFSVKIERSRSLPIHNSEVLTDFLNQSNEKDQYEILLEFEEWLKTQE